MKDTQKPQLISTDLRQIAAQAKQEPAMVFTSLAHRMDIDFLTEAYHRYAKTEQRDSVGSRQRTTSKT